MLPAVVTTIGRTYEAVLLNVSPTGARLRGQALPERGSVFVIKVDAIKTFATVVWSKQNLCGIVFDEPLTNMEVAQLQREARRATFTKLTPEERMALADWSAGLAR